MPEQSAEKLRLSVVIIAFNLENYIDDAIKSVLGQNRHADEIVVVDDCSTDRSAERIKAYADRLRYLKMPANSGALLTALRGIEATSGDIVSMLDGDDYWAANKLEVVEREFLADSGLVLLSHEHVRVDEHGAELAIVDDTHRNIASLRRRAKSRDNLSDLLKNAILEQSGYWLGSAYSIRKDALDIPTLKQQLSTCGSEQLQQSYLDLVIAPFLVLTSPAKRVGYAPDTTLYYRVHSRGSMARNTTPDLAQNSARKARRTNEVIDTLLQANGASPEYVRRRQLILLEYDFLCALYASNFRTATVAYLRLASRHWTWRQLVKETKRLAAVRFLGAQKFLDLKTKT